MEINRKQTCADMRWAVAQRNRKLGGKLGEESVAALFRIESDAEKLAEWLRELGWEARVVAFGGDAR